MNTVTMTRSQFQYLDPHFRTRVDAPVLVTRMLVNADGTYTILREGVRVLLVEEGE